MKAVIEHSHPYTHARHDDFTYDPVIVKVYRWLEGMEDALNRRRREASVEESEPQA